MFANRQQAGMLLTKEIRNLVNKEKIDSTKIIILGLPRGGVPVGLEIAQELKCGLNIIVAKKIGSPYQSELAIGAITADGTVVINNEITNYLKISQRYIDAEKARLINQCKQAEEYWRIAANLKPNLNVQGNIIIVVDDGVATGMTAIAAARSLCKQQVSKLILATPVISTHAYELLSKEYDKVIALAIPEEFAAVGQFYFDFSQVDDQEVIEALNAAATKEINHSAPVS